MATSDDWKPPKDWVLKGGSGEKHQMPDAGKLSFKEVSGHLEIKEIKDGKGNSVICDWGNIQYTFVTGSSCTQVQGEIGSKKQSFVIELLGTSPNRTLECTIARTSSLSMLIRSSGSGRATWLKKVFKALFIPPAVGDTGSWTAEEGT